MTSDLKTHSKDDTLKLAELNSKIIPRTKPILDMYASMDKVTDGLM